MPSLSARTISGSCRPRKITAVSGKTFPVALKI
jgi:hypothetical protein